MTLPIDSRTAALWLFDEQFDSVTPSDSAGDLADLEAGATLTRPPVVPILHGFARSFTASPASGLEAVDTGDALLLDSSASIVARVALDVPGQNTAATPGTIVWRGRDTELTSLGLRVTVIDLAGELVRLQMVWEDSAGVEVVDTGVVVHWLTGESYLIAAIRELEGDSLVCRYVVNGDIANGGTSANDVGGSSGASVYLGCQPTGVSAYTNHLVGSISYLEVIREAIAVEEVEQVWKLLSIDGPRSTVALKRLLPPGPYEKADPNTSTIHGELDIEAAALGKVRNLARLRRDYLLPGKAFGQALLDWEKLTRRPRYEDDSIDRRQARVEGYLQRAPGYNTADLKFQLAELLGYSDPDLADILKYTVDQAGFTAGVVKDDGNGTITGTSSQNIVVTAGDVRFLGTGVSSSPYSLMSLTSSLDSFFGLSIDRNSGAVGNDLGGIMIGSRSSNEWLFVGVDGNSRLSLARFSAGQMDAAFTVIDATNISGVVLRFSHRGEGVYDLQYGANDAAAQAQTPMTILGPLEPRWVGAAVISLDASITVDYDFTSYYSHEVNGTAPVTYHVFRDPLDGGEYDVEGAHRLLQEVGPTHFEGFVIDVPQMLLDDEAAGLDRAPMGI